MQGCLSICIMRGWHTQSCGNSNIAGYFHLVCPNTSRSRLSLFVRVAFHMRQCLRIGTKYGVSTSFPRALRGAPLISTRHNTWSLVDGWGNLISMAKWSVGLESLVHFVAVLVSCYLHAVTDRHGWYIATASMISSGSAAYLG